MKLPKEASVQLETMNSAILELRELRGTILSELVNDYRQYPPGFTFIDGNMRYEVGEATIVQGEICYWCNCIQRAASSLLEEGAPYLESTIEQLLPERSKTVVL